MKTTSLILLQLLRDIESSPFTVARVCREAGIHQSQVSRWKASGIEPRMSSLERLSEAFEKLQAEYRIAHPEVDA